MESIIVTILQWHSYIEVKKILLIQLVLPERKATILRSNNSSTILLREYMLQIRIARSNTGYPVNFDFHSVNFFFLG